MKPNFTELTDSQWQLIEKTLVDQRHRWHSLRVMTNAILSIVWSGTQWRNLDSKYPPWQSVYYYYRKWKRAGLFQQLLSQLVIQERRRQGRADRPSLLIFDSQSIKKGPFAQEQTGWDGAKWLKGRKRHLAVDCLGLPWAIVVTGAQISDSAGGCFLADAISQSLPGPATITVDAGYQLSFLNYLTAHYPHYRLEIVSRPEKSRGFVPQKRRWMVERSFGWLNFRRRLSKDFEKCVDSAQAMIQLAFISFLLPRLAK